jgi:hypothetical protein
LDGGSQGQVENGPHNYGWMLGNASYVRIEGFEIKNFAYGGIGLANDSTAINVYFYGNKVHDIGRYHITSTTCSSGSDPANGRSGIGSGSSASYITIDSNVIYNVGRLPGGNCTSYDYNHDHGLYSRASYVTAINNIFYDNIAGWAIQLIESTNHWDIVNNTFYGTNPQRNGHIIIVGDNKNVNIENNISYGATNSFIWFYWSSGGTVNLQNNLVYNGSLVSCTDDGNGNCSRLTYTQPNNITGQDPKFVNLANRDFHLQSGSPAIDKGIHTRAPDHDFDGKTRSKDKLCDIGAYEFIISSMTK